MSDELVEVVDLDGRVIDIVTRARMRAEHLCHRCVAIVVLSPRHELLVHRRAAWKDVWPGRWDIAVGGVVTAGESWESAARRELFEEVGISGELAVLGPATYDDGEVRWIGRLYSVVSPGPFHFNDDEVIETRWVRDDELAAFVASHECCPDMIEVALPLLLAITRRG